MTENVDATKESQLRDEYRQIQALAKQVTRKSPVAKVVGVGRR